MVAGKNTNIVAEWYNHNLARQPDSFYPGIVFFSELLLQADFMTKHFADSADVISQYHAFTIGRLPVFPLSTIDNNNAGVWSQLCVVFSGRSYRFSVYG